MARREVRWSALVGLCAALGYGGAQLACSSGDDSAGGDGSADGGGTDATASSADAAVNAPDASPDAATDGAVDMCFPSGVMPLTGGFTYPDAGEGACTDTQLQALFTACLGPSASNAACNTLGQTLGYATCFACVIGPATANPQAPVAYTLLTNRSATINLPNVGGCIAAFDPAEEACAEANTVADTCEEEQCAGCNVSDFTETATAPYGAIYQCTVEAADAGGACATYQAAEDACDDAIMAADSGAAACFSLYDDNGNVTPAYVDYVSLICGPPRLDGGVTDASTSDAAAADASDGGT